MSKRIIALISALTMALFSGCSQKLEEDQILSVRFRNNGKIITIGDSAAHVDRVTGGKQKNDSFMELDQVLRLDFWNAEGVYVDLFEETVVGLRLTSNNNWEISNGLRVGMSKTEAWDRYRDLQYVEEGMLGGILLSYDENLNPIPFDQFSYYLINISFDEDDKVDYIGIHTRIAEMTLRERGEYYGDEEDEYLFEEENPTQQA